MISLIKKLFKKEPKKQEIKNLPVIIPQQDSYATRQERLKSAYIAAFMAMKKTDEDLLQ